MYGAVRDTCMHRGEGLPVLRTMAGISRFTSMSVALCTSKLRWNAAGSAAVEALV